MLHVLLSKNNAHPVCHKARQSLNYPHRFENTGTSISSCIVMDTDYGILCNQVARHRAQDQRIPASSKVLQAGELPGSSL
jgi:hypothetical protein